MIRLDADQDYEFFNKDKAMERFQSLKNNDAHWLQVKNLGKGQMHVDFVVKKDTQDEETEANQHQQSNFHSKKKKNSKLSKKAKELSQLLGFDVRELSWKPSRKRGRPMKVIEVKKIQKTCALCEKKFPVDALVGEQLRSSIFHLRRIFEKNASKDHKPHSVEPWSRLSQKDIMLGEEEGEHQPKEISPAVQRDRFKFSRLYDKVRVCRFCNQFFPFDEFEKSIRQRKANLKLQTTRQEQESQQSNNETEQQREEHEVRDTDHNQDKEDVEIEQTKNDQHTARPFFDGYNLSRYQAERTETPEMRQEPAPIVGMLRSGSPARKRPTREELLRQLNEMKRLMNDVEKGLQGKQVAGLKDKVAAFLQTEATQDEKPWVPSGCLSPSPGHAMRSLIPHPPTTPNNAKQRASPRLPESAEAILHGISSFAMHEAFARPPKARKPPPTMKDQVKTELRRLHAEDGCLVLEHRQGKDAKKKVKKKKVHKPKTSKELVSFPSMSTASSITFQ